MSDLKTNRGWFKYLFLTLITCGIYAFFFYYKLIKDLNKVCAEDGKHTPGLLKYFLLSLVTFGIYGIIWMWKAANRIRAYGERNNVDVSTSGPSWFLWNTVGCLLFGLGPIIALHKFLSSMNRICLNAQAREKAAAEQAALEARLAEEEAKRKEEEAKHKEEEEQRMQAMAAAQAAAIAEAVAKAMADANAKKENNAEATEKADEAK